MDTIKGDIVFFKYGSRIEDRDMTEITVLTGTVDTSRSIYQYVLPVV